MQGDPRSLTPGAPGPCPPALTGFPPTMFNLLFLVVKARGDSPAFWFSAVSPCRLRAGVPTDVCIQTLMPPSSLTFARTATLSPTGPFPCPTAHLPACGFGPSLCGGGEGRRECPREQKTCELTGALQTLGSSLGM